MAEEQHREVIEFPQARLSAGARLRATRERAGFTIEDVAAETRIPIRMLTLIEAGNYAALPAKAYAMGFTRTYARALGLDADELVGEVRRELGMAEPHDAPRAPAFEPGDPARVPTARFAWLAAVAALVVLAAGLVMWRSYYAPSMTLPPLPETTAPAAAIEPMPPLAPAGTGEPVAGETVAAGGAPLVPAVTAGNGPVAGAARPSANGAPVAAAPASRAPAASRPVPPAAAPSGVAPAVEAPSAVSGGPVAGARATATPPAGGPSTTQ